MLRGKMPSQQSVKVESDRADLCFKHEIGQGAVSIGGRKGILIVITWML